MCRCSGMEVAFGVRVDAVFFYALLVSLLYPSVLARKIVAKTLMDRVSYS